MTRLCDLLHSRFRGRHDHIAVWKGSHFEPAKHAMKPEWLEARHLSGEQCLGFYLLTHDSKCHCTAIDFDNKPESPDPEWKEKAEKTYFELVKMNLHPLVEISQSGNAAHVWLFFDEPVDAWIVRQFWQRLEKRVGVLFKEIYPRQDRLEPGGIGNLIRYPLYGKSAFVDVENEWVQIDPIKALQSIRPTSMEEIMLICHDSGMGEIAGAEAPNVASSRVDSLLKMPHTLLARRWNGDTEGLKDASKSGLAMSIACELVRLYIPTDEIKAAIRIWCEKNDAAEKAQRDDWVNRTVRKAYDFAIQRTEKLSSAASTFRDVCHLFIDEIERGISPVIGSGIQAVDHSIGGVAPGEMCVIAARPSHGKSGFAFQWLDRYSKSSGTCLLISEEMSFREIGKRRLLAISGIQQEQWDRETVSILRTDVNRHHDKCAKVYVVEGCNTIERAESVIDQFCSMHGVGLVAVDYLQLLTAKKKDRYEAVTEISRRLKQTAKRNKCAMLVLCQLNREIDKRDGRKPKLSDLRESGQIEQDADIVMFLQWPKRYQPEASDTEYLIYFGKNRNGDIKNAEVKIRFDASRQRFA